MKASTPPGATSEYGAEHDRPGAGRVVVLGSVNMDLVVPAPHVPGPGETVIAGPARYLPGGKGANQAVTAARLGAEVGFIGRTGDDDFGRTLRRALQDAGVRVEHLQALPATTSGIAFVAVDPRGENTVVVSPGANALLTPEDLDSHRELIGWSTVAIAQLETPLETVLRFASLCADHGVSLVLNAAPYRRLPQDLLRDCAYLVVNRAEATALTGIPTADREGARRALAAAAELGPRAVVITLGTEGCLAWHGDEWYECDAYRVPVADTTGAGDAFVGALAVALARDLPLARALPVAAAAGALACRGYGAQQPDLSWPALEDLMRGQPSRARLRRMPVPRRK